MTFSVHGFCAYLRKSFILLTNISRRDKGFVDKGNVIQLFSTTFLYIKQSTFQKLFAREKEGKIPTWNSKVLKGERALSSLLLVYLPSVMKIL